MNLVIDVANTTVCRDSVNGTVLASYALETRRGWNFGRKKHVRELTGRIIVSFPSHGNNYSVCEDWAEVKAQVRKVFDVSEPQTL